MKKKLANIIRSLFGSQSYIIIFLSCLLLIPHFIYLGYSNRSFLPLSFNQTESNSGSNGVFSPKPKTPSAGNLSFRKLTWAIKSGINYIKEGIDKTISKGLTEVIFVLSAFLGVIVTIFSLIRFLTKRKFIRKFFWFFRYRYELNKYRHRLRQKHSHITLPFNNKELLKMSDVYIQISLNNSFEKKNYNILTMLNEPGNKIILGSPGSGKSLLCGYIMYSYGCNEDYFNNSNIVPIMFKCSEIIAGKERFHPEDIYDFDAENKLKYSKGNFDLLRDKFKKGQFIIIFDGFDEVPSNRHDVVLKYIKSIYEDDYKKNQIVVTCRKAVYYEQLSFISKNKYEIEDFTDKHIQSYISNYPTTDQAKRKELQDEIFYINPQIKNLANNPFMLSLICYLVLSAKKDLPAYRGDFYDMAIDHLLNKQFEKNNHINGKRIEGIQIPRRVLQKIANDIFFDNLKSDTATISYGNLRNAILSIIPNYNDDDADKFFTEIIHDTSIVREIDDVKHLYQFAHLTIQEYFIAISTKDKVDKLLSMIETQKDKCVEVVKIWCNISSKQALNSSHFLTILKEKDKLLSLECLTESGNKVEPEIARLLIKSFLPVEDNIEYNEKELSRIIKAFAYLIATKSSNEIAQEIFIDFCTRLEKSNSETEIRFIINVLSASSHKDSLEILVNNRRHSNIIITALKNMGNLAVRSLLEMCRGGKLQAVRCLYEIDTENAITSLISLVWEKNNRLVSYWASLYISILLKKNENERIIRQMEFKNEDEYRQAPGLNWVWEPFDESRSALFFIANRIAYILVNQENKLVNQEANSGIRQDLYIGNNFIDQRLAIPMLISNNEEGIINTYEFIRPENKTKVEELFGISPRPDRNMWVNLNKHLEFSNATYFFKNSDEFKFILFLLFSNILIICTLIYYAPLSKSSSLRLFIFSTFLMIAYLFFALNLNKKLPPKYKNVFKNLGMVNYQIEMTMYSILIVGLIVLNSSDFIINNKYIGNWVNVLILDVFILLITSLRLTAIKLELESKNPLREFISNE